MKNRIQLLKNIACAAGIVLLTAGSVNADLVVFTDADAVGATTNVGTLAAVTAPTGAFTLQSYTVNGLDLDSDGTFDPFTITYDISATNTAGSAITFVENDNTAANEYRVGGGSFNNANGSITLGAITLVPGTSSTGAPLVLNSAVYDSVNYRRWPLAETGGDISSISGIGGTTITGNTARDVTGLSGFTTLTTAWEGGVWNLDDVGFTIDVTAAAVPEPSALALLGLGGLFLASRRRRA